VGAALAIERALRDAGLSADAIEYVNAHATGTPVGDVAEALAIARTIGSAPVSSVKGALGHTIAAAGAIEAAACVAALQGGFMPGTAGLINLDPACPIEVVQAPRAATLEVVLSNSFGFGGQNAALVLAHADSERV
jgi:3-oxoacyl-(acyl-carrier-protein) synthase